MFRNLENGTIENWVTAFCRDFDVNLEKISQINYPFYVACSYSISNKEKMKLLESLKTEENIEYINFAHQLDEKIYLRYDEIDDMLMFYFLYDKPYISLTEEDLNSTSQFLNGIVFEEEIGYVLNENHHQISYILEDFKTDPFGYLFYLSNLLKVNFSKFDSFKIELGEKQLNKYEALLNNFEFKIKNKWGGKILLITDLENFEKLYKKGKINEYKKVLILSEEKKLREKFFLEGAWEVEENSEILINDIGGIIQVEEDGLTLLKNMFLDSWK